MRNATVRIVVIVQHGMVTGVRCSDPAAVVDVLDLDTQEPELLEETAGLVEAARCDPDLHDVTL